MNITWLHNNKTANDEFGIMVFPTGKKGSSLSIESVGAEHMGEYSCVAQNEAGSNRQTAILNVNGIHMSDLSIISQYIPHVFPIYYLIIY